MNLSRSGPAKRTAAFLLCVFFSCVAFWTGTVTLDNWQDLWSAGNYYDSYSIYEPINLYYSRMDEALSLRQTKEWEGSLTYSEETRYGKLMEQLDAKATNFRYQIHSEDGRMIDNNLEGEALEAVVDHISMYLFTLRSGDELRQNDDIGYDEQTQRSILLAYDGKSHVSCDPALTLVGEYNEYGYSSVGDGWGNYSVEFDQRVRSVRLAAEYGVCAPLERSDEFMAGQADYNNVLQWLPLAAAVAALSLALSLALTLSLCRVAGRGRDAEGVVRSWQERIPLDLYLLLSGFLVTLLLGAVVEASSYSNHQTVTGTSIVGISIFTGLMAAVLLGALLTVVARLRAHMFWRSMLLVRLWWALWRTLRHSFSQWPMIGRTVILFLLYLAGTALSSITLVLIPVFQGFVLWHLCRWVKQWRTIRDGTGWMVQGEPSFKIDTARLYPDLRVHAEQLNDLSSGMARAVEEQMKGERFKAELITNVSHDLKTPLTSIISYVDLLKKTGIEDRVALEYIEVLERKSQRLKKLTEDLVAASKASTGNLTVAKEMLGFTQLLTQALGEYEEKLDQSGLSTVVSTPDHEVYVEADGRHLWRVLDNLLGNCVKYAMPGTRVYVDVKAWDGQVCLLVKNISERPLNVAPDQLMERFVRGDESRTTEGSGLGLSIARSLTELQGGTFRIDIDGDLFKAVVSFPESCPPLPLTGGRDVGTD